MPSVAKTSSNRIMREVGKLLQVVGLVLPPLSIVMNVMGYLQRPLQMLSLLVVAVCLFLIGRLLEGYARG
jgi:hypothetical protein